jgi:hypothetical protein
MQHCRPAKNRMSAQTTNPNHLAKSLSALAKSGGPDYTFRMLVTSIRELNRAVPFRPYKIKMVSGESFVVPHPDFVLVSQKGSFVIFVDAEDCPHHLSSLLIESVAPHNGHRARKRG